MSRTDKNFELQKEALIHIALEVFIKNGYENTTMTQLRKALNLSVGGMYHYFSSKEEILDAVIQYGLQQGVKETRAKLETIPIENQLLHFLSDNTVNDFAMKLYQYKEDNKNSLVAYKLREQNINLFIPVVIEIFQQSIDAGIYKTDFPDEMAEFSMLLAKAIIETNFLPEGDLAKRKKRVDAFLYIWKTAMNTQPDHLEEIRAAFYYGMEAQEERPQ